MIQVLQADRSKTYTNYEADAPIAVLLVGGNMHFHLPVNHIDGHKSIQIFKIDPAVLGGNLNKTNESNAASAADWKQKSCMN